MGRSNTLHRVAVFDTEVTATLRTCRVAPLAMRSTDRDDTRNAARNN